MRERPFGCGDDEAAGLKPRPTVSGAFCLFEAPNYVFPPKRCHCEEYRRYDAAIRDPTFEVVPPKQCFNR